MLMLLANSCKKDPVPDPGIDLSDIEYDPQPFLPTYPDDYPRLEVPADNPITVDGVQLGRHLFFDPILSADSTMSCVNCHLPSKGWTDNLATSTGIDGVAGKMSAMSLFNVGFYNTGLFWNGRSPNLEDQAALPVEDPVELHDTWPNVEAKLKSNPLYHDLFRRAFGISNTNEITRDLATKALAQFQRCITASGQSKYDLEKAGLYEYSDLEFLGYNMYFDLRDDIKQVECNHCHSDPLLTANDYFNNGLQAAEDFEDFDNKGRGEVTGNIQQNGFFRAPSLYNVMLTAPYMHDGRLATIDDVLDHYGSGGQSSISADPLLRDLELTSIDRRAIKAFLNCFTDTAYLDNPLLTDPFND